NFFFQAEDGIRDFHVTGVQTCALPISKDYDKHFLNFCIQYDGQEDIAEASKMIARKILTGKLTVDDITPQTIKENVYSSYFIAQIGRASCRERVYISVVAD